MTVKSTMSTSNPAEETAAAVSSPEMAEATVNPDSTSMMMKSTIIPNGVFIMLMIVPVADPPPLGNFHLSSQRRLKGS